MIKLNETTDGKKICPFCKYEWRAKVDNPVSCVRCKHRFDFDEVKA